MITNCYWGLVFNNSSDHVDIILFNHYNASYVIVNYDYMIDSTQ